MHPHSSTTILKGMIGTVPPYFALLFHWDQWASPAQVCLGAVVPTLMGISLLFDIKKKWKDNQETDRQEKIKQARKDYFKAKHIRKKYGKIKPKFIEKDDGTIDPVDPANFM